MPVSRKLIAITAIIIFALVWNGFVHGIILNQDNLVVFEMGRTASERPMILALILTLAIGTLFVWTFSHWSQYGSLKDGLTHGLVFALLAGLLVDVNQYILYPLPLDLVMKWFAFGSIEFLCYGLIASSLYRKKD